MPESSSVAVSADAQFSLAKILRPLTGFEALYQDEPAVVVPGVSPSVPIPFFDSAKTEDPNYTGRDINAGENGFDPNLLDYVPVPMGALIKLWIPFPFDPADPLVQQSYRVALHWRVSDINAYAKSRGIGQYHLGTEQPGQPDTSVAPAVVRNVVPSAQSSIILNQAEAGGPVLGQNNNVRREYLVMRTGDGSFQPFLPAPGGGKVLGVYQQGITDPAFDPIANLSAFAAFELVASGDRLHITMDRAGVNGVETGVASNWDFNPGGLDQGFTIMYGTDPAGTPHPPFQNVGAYLFYGSAP